MHREPPPPQRAGKIIGIGPMPASGCGSARGVPGQPPVNDFAARPDGAFAAVTRGAAMRDAPEYVLGVHPLPTTSDVSYPWDV